MKPLAIAAVLATSVVAGLPAAAAADRQPIAIRDFVRDSEFLSAKVSPTGEFLAVAMPMEGQTMVGIIDLKSKKVAGHLRFPKGEHVAEYSWVGPNRIVASVATSYGPLDQPYLTGELYGINVDGSQRTYLYGRRGADHQGMQVKGVVAERGFAFVVDPLPDEPGVALISIASSATQQLSIQRLNVYTGTRELVTVLPGFELEGAVADRQGRPRMVASQDENRSHRLYAKANTPSGWKELKLPEGEPSSIDLHRAANDGSSVFLTSTSQKGRACLREYRFDSGAFTDLLCSDSGVVGTPVFGLDDAALIALVHDSGKPEIEFLNAQHPDARLLRLLSNTWKGQNVSMTSHTRDGKYVVVLVHSDRNPGDFYLVDRQSRKADYLLSARAWIDPAAAAPSDAIEYRTRDGATIHGYLTAPDGLKARKGPLVLMPHGGPHMVRDDWGWNPAAQLLASRGYAVLQVNYRGSAGYGDLFEVAGYRKWASLMQDDLTDAVRWAIEQGIADPARICIMGGSYGGYAALMSPIREPELYRCAIAMAGVYDLVSLSRDSDVAESRVGRNYLAEILGDTTQMRENSPLTYIEKLKTPVLVMHGTDDERAPFNQAKQLRKALDKNKKSYEWAEYEDEGHGLYLEANRIDYFNKVFAFLDKHIGAGAAPAAAK